MNNECSLYDFDKIDDPYLERLAREHCALEDLRRQSDVIDFEIVGQEREKPNPPNSYLITFKVKSIVGIKDDLTPIYGNEHKAEITLPQSYPMVGASCYMKTDLWHPNIKYHGKEKGHICSNAKDFGKRYNLYFLAHRIGEILQYKNYHAIEEPPHPDDEIVAEWVREYAEPKDIVNKNKGIVVDETPLLKPIETQEKPKAQGITILGITNDNASDGQNDQGRNLGHNNDDGDPPSDPPGGGIKILP
jgi:ubiquitin-protein ligase